MNRFLFLFSLICQLSFAQKSQIHNFEFDEKVNYTQFVVSEQHTQWQVALSFSNTSAANLDLNLLKLDSCQNLVFAKRFMTSQDQYNFLSDLIEVPHSEDIITVGLSYINGGKRSPYLIRFSPDGEVVWVKQYNLKNLSISNIYKCFQNADELILACKLPLVGGGASFSSFLRFDYDGNYIESAKFTDSFTGLSVVQLSEDEFLWRSSNQLARTKLSGEVVWAKKYQQLLNGSNFFPGVLLQDNAIFHVRSQNQTFLVSFDLDGNYRWHSEQFYLGSYPELFLTKQSNIGLFYSQSTPQPSTIYSSFDSSGKLMDSKQLTPILFNSSFSFSRLKRAGNRLYANYISSSLSTQTIVDLEAITCTTDYELVSEPIPKDTTFVDISSGFFTGMVELEAVDSFTLEEIPIGLTQSTDCINTTVFDSIEIQAFIDCDLPYQHQDNYPDASYFWPHNGSTDPNEIISESGTYQVLITGCSNLIKTIKVQSICNCRLTFPTAFSPNGDGLNDVFKPIDNCGIEFYKLKIWDRWGKLLFESDAVNQAWDGSYNNKDLPSDVYIYEVNYAPLTIKPSEHTIKKSGTFTLIK